MTIDEWVKSPKLRHACEGGHPELFMEFKLVSKREGQRTAFFPHRQDRVSDHIRIEERSIALHRAIADRIRTNPRLMEKARENLQKYLEHIIRAAGSITQDDEIFILRQRISMLRVEKSIKDRILKRIDK